MQILLLFLVIYLTFNVRSSNHGFRTDYFIDAVIIVSVMITIVSEFLSTLNLFTQKPIAVSWTILLLVFIIMLIKQKNGSNWKPIFTDAYWSIVSSLNKNKVLYGVIILLLSLLLLQGLAYPPNNYDSMVYHMPRIIHWVEQGSLAHFPTHIDRQLYQPPFAELVIANIYLLTGSDLFSNSIQLFFLIASSFLIGQIARLSGFHKRHRLYTIIVALTLPAVLLEATTTKNDIVVSFFILGTLYYSLKLISSNNWYNLTMIGLSASLAVFTKGTAYIFLAPIFLILFYFLTKRVKYGIGTLIIKSIFLLTILFAINSGHYYRNYALTGNLLGVSKSISDKYRNEDFAIRGITSNIIRNASLHLYVGESPIHDFTQSKIIELHEAFGLNPDDPRYTYTKKYLLGKKLAQEDTVPNFFHSIIFVIVLIVLLVLTITKTKFPIGIILIFIIIITQFFLFSIYLKWQPWHTRLHIPMFLLLSPLIVFGLRFLGEVTLKICTTILLIWALIIINLNYRRPLLHLASITSNIAIQDNRLKKYMPTSLNRYKDVMAINQIIDSYEGTIGLIVKGNAYIYPFLVEHQFQSHIRIVYINIRRDNISSNIVNTFNTPKYIITDNKNLLSTSFRNSKYEQLYKGAQYSILKLDETR